MSEVSRVMVPQPDLTRVFEQWPMDQIEKIRVVKLSQTNGGEQESGLVDIPFNLIDLRRLKLIKDGEPTPSDLADVAMQLVGEELDHLDGQNRIAIRIVGPKGAPRGYRAFTCTIVRLTENGTQEPFWGGVEGTDLAAIDIAVGMPMIAQIGKLQRDMFAHLQTFQALMVGLCMQQNKAVDMLHGQLDKSRDAELRAMETVMAMMREKMQHGGDEIPTILKEIWGEISPHVSMGMMPKEAQGRFKELLQKPGAVEALKDPQKVNQLFQFLEASISVKGDS